MLFQTFIEREGNLNFKEDFQTFESLELAIRMWYENCVLLKKNSTDRSVIVGDNGLYIAWMDRSQFEDKPFVIFEGCPSLRYRHFNNYEDLYKFLLSSDAGLIKERIICQHSKSIFEKFKEKVITSKVYPKEKTSEIFPEEKPKDPIIVSRPLPLSEGGKGDPVTEKPKSKKRIFPKGFFTIKAKGKPKKNPTGRK